MKLNRWIIWSIVIQLILIIVTSFMFNHRKSNTTSGEFVSGTALSIWVYSQDLETSINEFQQTYPNIDVDVRYFRSSDHLFTELMAAISANAAPQLAEIKSFYGIAQLVDAGAVLPVDNLSLPEWKKLQPTFTEPFHYSDLDWAVPIGGSIPLLYYREELMKNSQNGSFSGWSEVVNAAIETNLIGNEGATKGHWGIAIDKEVPWYLKSLNVEASNGNPAENTKFDSAISMWGEWVHSLNIMKPLTHRRAASDFINGKIGLFISSSEQLQTVERYIGGKFKYNAQRLPGQEEQGIVPSIDGLIVLNSSETKVKAANSFISYMIHEKTQDSLWRSSGLIPARSDVLMKLQEEGQWSTSQKTILDSVRMFSVKRPAKDDFERWEYTQSLLEQLEQEPKLVKEVHFEDEFGN
ncbi:extracellular solute-binding protein [Paenibacillus plantarum]|nr:extracellular solute-binding protein [Paenibacillus plantarum]